MTTPCHSGKYHFQAQVKGVSLPVTVTIPDIFDTTRGDDDDSSGFLTNSATEPDPVASARASDFTSQPFPSAATQQPEDAQASGTTAASPTTDSPDISLAINDLEILSVSVFCSV